MELMLYRSGGDEPARYPLANGETIIGRRPDCRMVLDAPSISPRHARLFTVDGHAVIHTIDEAWPVYVNGEPVRRRVLSDGDLIELGHYRIHCVDGASRGQFDAPPESAAAAGGEPDTGDATRATPDPAPDHADQDVAASAADLLEDHQYSPVDVPVDDAVPAAGDIETAMDNAVPAGDNPETAVAHAASALHKPDSTLGTANATAQDIGEFASDHGLPDAMPDATRDDADDRSSRGLEPTTSAVPEDQARREPDATPGMAAETRPREYHLDILTGINQGRRVAMTRERVVLGFNRQRLVEITNQDGTLSLRSIDAEAAARLNDQPITEEPVAAGPGDIISLQRIDLRIHQGY